MQWVKAKKKKKKGKNFQKEEYDSMRLPLLIVRIEDLGRKKKKKSFIKWKIAPDLKVNRLTNKVSVTTLYVAIYYSTFSNSHMMLKRRKRTLWTVDTQLSH